MIIQSRKTCNPYCLYDHNCQNTMWLFTTIGISAIQTLTIPYITQYGILLRKRNNLLHKTQLSRKKKRTFNTSNLLWREGRESRLFIQIVSTLLIYSNDCHHQALFIDNKNESVVPKTL